MVYLRPDEEKADWMLMRSCLFSLGIELLTASVRSENQVHGYVYAL